MEIRPEVPLWIEVMQVDKPLLIENHDHTVQFAVSKTVWVGSHPRNHQTSIDMALCVEYTHVINLNYDGKTQNALNCHWISFHG